MKGVVAGVRDYGTDGNPHGLLERCTLIRATSATAGVLRQRRTDPSRRAKSTHAGDLIVAVAGGPGRDGIHGYVQLGRTDQPQRSGLGRGAVQIGNAITEKMLLDVAGGPRSEPVPPR